MQELDEKIDILTLWLKLNNGADPEYDKKWDERAGLIWQRSEILNAKKLSDISDGYHTFSELYRYRMLLQAAWLNALYISVETGWSTDQRSWHIEKSWRHHDGELCFGKDNYFIVTAVLPTGQISNHYKGEYWDLFKIKEVERAIEWDGHTPAEAADRIEKYLKGDY